jgi:hypothetical protein
MKSCIQQFNLDPKQAVAFNVICSSFMLAFLNDLTITKIGTDIEEENATRILTERGANSRLIMHLTGSGGSGKSFLLKARKTFCQQFCRSLGSHLMNQFLLCQQQQIQQQHKCKVTPSILLSV